MNSILFLDFDGVTHPDPCRNSEYFCQLPLIESILRSHNRLDIVISSSWRYDHQLSELQAHFSCDLQSRVIGGTPNVARTDDDGWIHRHLLQHFREWECQKWIRQHRSGGAPWLAIDDVPDWFTPGCVHLLQTQSALGFQPEQLPVLDRMIRECTQKL